MAHHAQPDISDHELVDSLRQQGVLVGMPYGCSSAQACLALELLVPLVSPEPRYFSSTNGWRHTLLGDFFGGPGIGIKADPLGPLASVVQQSVLRIGLCRGGR